MSSRCFETEDRNVIQTLSRGANESKKTGKATLTDSGLYYSVPFFMGRDNPEAMLAHYPHAAGAAYIPRDPGPDVITSMSQMLHVNAVASGIEGIPRTQRQWLQQYMTVLSRDPLVDRERAMRLELKI